MPADPKDLCQALLRAEDDIGEETHFWCQRDKGHDDEKHRWEGKGFAKENDGRSYMEKPSIPVVIEW